jgi:hypothetical protein
MAALLMDKLLVWSGSSTISNMLKENQDQNASINNNPTAIALLIHKHLALCQKV